MNMASVSRLVRFGRRFAFAPTLVGIVIVLAGVAAGSDKDEPLHVAVSVPPQAYIVEQVGGPYVDIQVLVGPGQSPATYEPTPRQMIELQQADIFFSIGVPFEAGLLHKIQQLHSHLSLVDMRSDLEGNALASSEIAPGNTETHDHHDMDPHVWMDPMNVIRMAQTVARRLSRLRPELGARFESNLQTLSDSLDSLDVRIRRRLADLPTRRFYVFHPAFGYFARAYGLTQVAVEVAGKEPGPAQLAEFIEQAKRDSISVIVVQPQFAYRPAETLASAVGARVLTLDPLARDYAVNLEEIAEKLAAALGGKSRSQVDGKK